MDESLAPFPDKDVYRLVCVPEKDKFGITNAVLLLGENSESSELYSSHAFMRIEESSDRTLRSKSNLVKKAEELHKALTTPQGTAPP